ncbi:MAG: ribosome biogenesis GTPase Der [Betaproteobacteria bacterium]|nr:ribosome biogenesis GTPase Der [Betaproteobacteria bacterium]MSQ88712.1 ribosome biogenesis GTPase Der [Betaproteobacteria bacterium]
MKPVIALVGRPNVGKSTLFNRLTRRRDAIVVDVPGVTRDRHYGEGLLGGRSCIVIDTGGLQPDTDDGIYVEMARQTEQAIVEADVVLLVTDARAGLTPGDRVIADQLRRLKERVWIAVNKAEGLDPETAAAEFHELGLGNPVAISAAHGGGVVALMEEVMKPFPQDDLANEGVDKHPRIAIVGRPNVGKSTLVNALVGEERVLVYGEPGTTRDAIEVPFERNGRRYTLVDTAGLRKRGKSHGALVERFSIIKTLQALEASNVAVLVLDALEGITEQDAHVASYILERGRALTIAVNKWEAADKSMRERLKDELRWQLGFLGFADTLFISAKSGKGVNEVLRSADAAYAAAFAKLSTPKLTRALIAAVERQMPPHRRGYARPKMRYAHQGGSNPPRVIIHGNSLQHVPDAYKRFLEGWFRDLFKLQGTPLRIDLRTGRNPYDENRKAPVRKRTLGHSKSAPRVKSGGKPGGKPGGKSSGRSNKQPRNKAAGRKRP